MTLEVDHHALDRISQTLTNAGTDLDGASVSAPTSVDGGLGTPAILGILARLVDNAGQLVVAVKAAGGAVASANARFREIDEPAADSENKTVWTGDELADRHEN